jgi:hypothetical protein
MRLLCSKCGTAWDSLIIDQRLAFKELVDKSTNHIKFKHPELFAALAVGIQKCSMALAQIVHFDECVVIPEEETWIQEQIMENTKLVMMALGFDAEEDEIEDEDDSEDEEDDSEGMPLIDTTGDELVKEAVELDKDNDSTKQGN